MSFLKKNICDGLRKTASVLFTSVCDNKCVHCISRKTLENMKKDKPRVDELVDSIFNSDVDYEVVSILGGEPCLFLDELFEFIVKIRAKKPSMRIELTTALPETCYKFKEKFFLVLKMCDFVILSAQSHLEPIADKIRGTTSHYDRQSFYKELPFKEKIQVSFLLTQEMLIPQLVTDCVNYYSSLGFQSVRINEMSGTQYYYSFEDIMDVKMKSAFSHGCLTKVNKFFPDAKSPVYLRRRCFVVEPTQQASRMDILKIYMVKIAKIFGYKNHLHRYHMPDSEIKTNEEI